MKTIEYITDLPRCDLHAYAVQDEEHAREIAEGKTAYLFKQTERAWYVFCEVSPLTETEQA